MAGPQASPVPPAAAVPDPGAAVLAEPALERLVERVRAALADGGALRIRGGGTKDFYGGELHGAPLDIASLSGICSYEPTEMVITARGGTSLAEIDAALAERGQCLAFEPPRLGPGTTIGGIVAAGLSGPSRASAGSVRDFVLGAVVLDGNAQLLRFGGQVMKNVAGYDVARLMPGALGVLGIVCEVSLKVLPLAPANTTLVFSCSQAQAIADLHRWTAAALPVQASAWHAEQLHLRLSGAVAAVQAGAARLSAERDGVRLDADAAASFWNALRDQRSAYFAHAASALAQVDAPAAEAQLWRLSLPSTTAPLALAGDTLVEWGGAQRWLLSTAPATEIRAAASRAGGHATLYRSRQRPPDFLTELPQELEQIHRSLKQVFDPKRIFNPGRLYSWL